MKKNWYKIAEDVGILGQNFMLFYLIIKYIIIQNTLYIFVYFCHIREIREK